MRAWQYTTYKGGLDKNLKLNPSAPVPKATSELNLVQVIATALNPVDYKLAESPLISTLLISKPATPSNDFAGRIITPAAGSPFKAGQLVFGVPKKSPFHGAGALREYTLAETDSIAAIPEGVSAADAATLPVAGLTAYQSIVPRVKKGDKIFINGGSGGVGVLGIQMAKVMGCHVTTSCSTANVELCKSLGADEVVDYKKGSVIEALKASGNKFDHVVDNVGTDWSLFWSCHEFTKPEAVYLKVAGDMSLSSMVNNLRKKLPVMLGGAKRKSEGFWPNASTEDISKIAEWVKEGKIKAVIDQRFPFEQAPEAFAKLKTGRARGKIVVNVASEN
jgi:NADPH:quinone reductase-like Zn-dependent oxidoreductase